MDHSHHAMHAGHAGHAMGEAHHCQMSMLFTWKTQDLCLVFKWWHVRDTFTLVLSLLGVVALSAGYELLRELARRYEARVDASALIKNDQGEEVSSLLPERNFVNRSAKKPHVGKALFYGAQVFYSFFIMLLFMTYNGWVMIAVAIGASFGYMLWGGGSASKSVACH